jgi:putative ABC transport system permease protein
MSRSSALLRLMAQSLVRSRRRSITAVLAVMVATTVVTAAANLALDMRAKMSTEFRRYGANITVAARPGSALSPDALHAVDAALAANGFAVPYAYAVAKTFDGEPIVVAGTDLARARRMNPWWSVSQWPQQSREALLGVRARAALSPQGQPFTLYFNDKPLTITPVGTLQTGASEDSRVYFDLAALTQWTGEQPTLLEVAATGATSDIQATLGRLRDALPGLDVRPVRQVVEAEAKVVGKTTAAMLATVALIVLTSTLCLLATLTSWMLDRRKDFALMKALGASDLALKGIFALESAALAVIGALAGYAAGLGVAAWIGRANFHVAIAPRWSVLPWVVAGSLAVVLLAALGPMSLMRRLQPSAMLRGE